MINIVLEMTSLGALYGALYTHLSGRRTTGPTNVLTRDLQAHIYNAVWEGPIGLFSESPVTGVFLDEINDAADR